MAAKQRAKGARALKAHLKADVGHRSVRLAEEPLRIFQAPGGHILMGGLVENLPEGAQKMVRREAGGCGHLIEGDGPMQRGEGIVTGAMEAAIKLLACRGADGRNRFDLRP